MTALRIPRAAQASLLILLLLFLGGCAREERLAPTVILISIDGMRHDYPEKTRLPSLDRLIRGGVRGELIPTFPTLTFTNHYSHVTGLYPENHGIVHNSMYDPEFDARFSMGNVEAVTDGRWWEGEPIWVTAVKQGQRASACFWPGSEAEIAGHRPTTYLRYSSDLPVADRLNCIFSGLDQPSTQRHTFYTLYFSVVDSAGHRYGPESQEVINALEEVDAALGQLIAGLEQRGLFDEVNILIVSDHGMIPTPIENVILVDEIFKAQGVDAKDADVIAYGPYFGARSRRGDHESIYRALNAHKARNQGPYRVFRKEEVPERLHHRKHRRIPPVVGLADEGWTFTTRDHVERRRDSWSVGSHGFDNEYPKMRAFFLAHGPAFRRNTRAAAFDSVHLYELMCDLLGLKPAPNDGRLEASRSLRR